MLIFSYRKIHFKYFTISTFHFTAKQNISATILKIYFLLSFIIKYARILCSLVIPFIYIEIYLSINFQGFFICCIHWLPC